MNPAMVTETSTGGSMTEPDEVIRDRGGVVGVLTSRCAA